MNCRHCATPLHQEFINLVNSPASNSFLKAEQLNEPETFYPLRLFVCHSCFLVQIDEYKKATDIFGADYAYFSSFSKSWLAHCKAYTDMITPRLGLGKDSLVVELASNDGYLLQYFKEKEIPVLGIEPTANTAQVAIEKGVNTLVEYFTDAFAQQLAGKGTKADLIIGNNVLAHVPDINDFVRGMATLLKPEGVITMEFPHALQMIEQNQFDTIYHEHFSYLSLHTVTKVFAQQGLTIFDVEEVPTHGGSLRIYAKHASSGRQGTGGYEKVAEKENKAGITDLAYYQGFQEKANQVKYGLLSFLLEQKKAGKRVAGYGAAAKGNTLLNYCGVKQDMIDFIVDASTYKQGRFAPASHIPIVAESVLREQKPDFVLILPWNLEAEITQQLAYIREWGGKFVIPIPTLQVK
jgi:2-polyprenyl-3-methyl-5-hydroxy-6-metoxy-1,4-benzoquinol methylase